METKNKNKSMFILLSIAVGTFMSALDTSVVNIAAPVIQKHFGVSLSMVEWVITAYLLFVSSMLLTFGRLSDLFGHKKIYRNGFMVFTVGSLLCGLSFNIYMLILCRIFQGLGASMMFSSSSAIITKNIPENKRGKAFGLIAIAVAVACCTGPVIGGMLADTLGWQSIFFINVPVGIFGIIMVQRNIPAEEEKQVVGFDILGSILIFAGLFLILLPLDLVGNNEIKPLLFFTLLTIGLAIFMIFIFYERKAKNPLIKLSLFENRVFSASLIAAVFNYMAQFIMVFLAPFYFENIRLLSPTMAGMLYLPMPLATIIIAPISGSFSDKHDSRMISSLGMGIMAVSLFMLSFLKVDTSQWYIIVSLMLAGIGSGMFQSPNNSAIMGNAPANYRGVASGTLATMRNVGMVLGVALSGALFNFTSGKGNGIYQGRGLTGISLKQEAFTYGLHITFLVAAVVAVFAMIASLVKGKVGLASEIIDSNESV